MAIFQILIRYHEFNKGWEEVLYGTAGNAQQATNWDDFALGTILLCHSQATFIDTIEARDVDNPRNSFTRTVNQFRQAFPSTSPERITVDVSGVAARMQLISSAGAKRYLWMRGLPDKYVERDPITGADTPSAFATIQFGNWHRLMTNSLGFTYPKPLLCRRYDDTPPFDAFYRVTGIAANVANPSNTDLTLSAALNPGIDIVRVLGAPLSKLPGLKGQFEVLARNGDVITIGYTLRGPVVGGFGTKLRVQGVSYTYSPITTSQFTAFVTRDTGRPTSGGRGRSRAVIRRQ